MLIGVAQFSTLGREVPFAEVKQGLKEALLLVCGTNGNPAVMMENQDSEGSKNKTQDLRGKRSEQLKSLIAYNLSIVNYAELLMYQERDASSFLENQSLAE